MVVCRQALALGSFSTLKPSLSHPVPSRLARGIARKLSHLLAVGGVSQKFISRVHRGHETLTLVSWPPLPNTIHMRDQDGQEKSSGLGHSQIEITINPSELGHNRNCKDNEVAN
jgi:hypothetical protein